MKGNGAYNTMLANVLPLQRPLTQHKQMLCFFIHPRPQDGIKGSRHFFSEGHVAYQIKGKEV